MKIVVNNLLKPCNHPKWDWILLIVPLFLFSLNSCSKQDDSSTTDEVGTYNTKTILHDGVQRTYHVYLPNNYNITTPSPLVLALHGGSGTGMNLAEVISAGTLTDAAESKNLILVVPDGKDKRWNDGRPEIFGNDRMYDDVGFISTIIDDMINDYGVDSNRVYATGISNGGYMSIRLAMDLSNKIAAVAPVTAQITKAMESEIPEFPISIMFVNGEDDPIVPYYGGCIDVPLFPNCSRGEVLSTEESIEKFKGYNQCINPLETEPIIDNVPNDGTSIEISKFKGCERGTEVSLIKVIGGGHTWPGGGQYYGVNLIGKVSEEIDASALIFDFFLSHSKN